MLITQLKNMDYISDKTFENAKKILLPIGMLMLASGLILKRYCLENASIDFLSGFLIGLSMVLNIAGIVNIKLKRRR